MNKLIFVLFTCFMFLFVGEVEAGGGYTSQGNLLNYRIDKVTMDSEMIHIYGWAYHVGDSFNYHTKGNNMDQHNYQLVVNNIRYSDALDYSVDHTYLNSVIGIKTPLYQNIGFHFQVPIKDVLATNNYQFMLELEVFHQYGIKETISLSYLSTIKQIETKEYTLSVATDTNPVLIYTNSNYLYVREHPKKSSTIAKNATGQNLYFTRGDLYSLNDSTMTGKIEYDNETNSYWYQIRYNESHFDGRQRVKANSSGRYGWICDAHIMYVGTPMVFSLTPKAYEIQYVADEATNVPSRQVKLPQVNTNISTLIPTRSGYTFTHWSGDDSVYNPGQVYSKDKSIILYATWNNDYPVISDPKFNENEETVSGVTPFINEGKIIVQVGDKFDLLNYLEASDKEDGNITHKLQIDKGILPYDKDGYLSTSGEYELSVSVTDKGGNKTTRNFTIYINEAPNIICSDRYYLEGWNVDKKNLLEKVVASDKEDGDITNKVEIMKITYPNKEEYTPLIFDTMASSNDYTISKIEYKVTDEYKRSILKTANLYVYKRYENRIDNSQLRYISKDYITTLDSDSIWAQERLHNNLQESLSSNEGAQYTFFIKSDDIKDSKIWINKNGYGSNDEFYKLFLKGGD